MFSIYGLHTYKIVMKMYKVYWCCCLYMPVHVRNGSANVLGLHMILHMFADRLTDPKAGPLAVTVSPVAYRSSKVP